MRFLNEGSTETVPIAANMIYEIAADGEGAELRDQHAGFMAYVPQGSIAKGKELASTGGNGKTVACAICHGPDYRGIGNVPRLAAARLTTWCASWPICARARVTANRWR